MIARRLLLSAIGLATASCGQPQNSQDDVQRTNISSTNDIAAARPETTSTPPEPLPPAALPPPPQGLSDSEKAQLTGQVLNFLNGLPTYQEGSTVHFCTEAIRYGPSRIRDALIEGRTGRIVVETRTEQIAPFDSHVGYLSMRTPRQICHLTPSVAPGVTVTVEEEFAIERWDSGWQLVLPRR